PENPKHGRVEPIGAGSCVDEEIAVWRLTVHHSQRAIEVDALIRVQSEPVAAEQKQKRGRNCEHAETGSPMEFDVQSSNTISSLEIFGEIGGTDEKTPYR